MLEDHVIVEYFWNRNEQAIRESSLKYGTLCYSIAYNILLNRQDSEECVNSTWMKAWNSIPPQRPNKLSAYFAKITRNLSLNKLKSRKAAKRGGTDVDIAVEELWECLPSSFDVEAEYQKMELLNLINQFLYMLPVQHCNIFIRRYFFVQPVKEIARQYQLKENHVSVILSRIRKELYLYLQKEYFYDV